jgi:putative membrane protein
MKRLLIRLAINAVALYVAIALLNGTYLQPQSENWLSFLWLALIFGLINAILRPILIAVSCPILILTLGLGTLLINTLLFALAGWVGTQFGVGFTVNGFLGAFYGSLIVSIVSFFLNLLLAGEMRR